MGVGQQRGGRGLQGTPASLRPVGRGEERSLNAFQKISCEWPGRVIRIKLINPLLVSQGGNPDVAVYLFWISPFFFFFPSLFLLTPSSRRFLKGQGCLAALAELRALSAGVGPPLGPAATDTPLGGGGGTVPGVPLNALRADDCRRGQLPTVYIGARSPGSCSVGTPHAASGGTTRCPFCGAAPLLLTSALT